MKTAFMGSSLLLCVIILYLLLAFGLPFGELAMGGKYKVLPAQYGHKTFVDINSGTDGVNNFQIVCLLQSNV